MGLGASGAFTQALAFPFPEPQRSVWSPGAAEPVPEEKERAGKGAILPGKGVRQHINGGCSFLLCLVRKKKNETIKNIYTFLSPKRRVVSGFINWWGLFNTKWLRQMMEQKREDLLLIALEFSVQGGESEAVSDRCLLLPEPHARLAPAPPEGPQPTATTSPAPDQP